MPEEMAESIGIGHLRGKGYRVGVGVVFGFVIKLLALFDFFSILTD